MIGLKCEICGHREKTNLKKHLETEHKLSTKQYRAKYPNSRTMTGHSKRTVEYWIYREGYSYKQAKQAIKRFQSIGKKNFIKNKIKEGLSKKEAQKVWNLKQAKCSPRSLEHYLAKGLSIEQAKAAQSKTQAKFSALSSKFSGHKHTEESRKKISKSSKLRALEVGHVNMANRFRIKSENGVRSNLEIECYNELKQIFVDLKSNVEIGNYIADMVLGKLVIEFFGDFWHRNPRQYLAEDKFYGKTSKSIWEYDKKRLNLLTRLGYDTIVIWESDWNENKEEIIKQIKKLYESKQDGKPY